MIRFWGTNCTLKINRYVEGNRIALSLVDEDGMPMGMATVNLPDIPIPKDCAFIKDYSENEGLVEALTSAGIITEQVGEVRSGHVMIGLYKLNMIEIYNQGVDPS
jgi:hypothetical protein